MIATWCWNLLEPYLRRNLTNRGVERPTRKQVLEEFARVWPEVTATLGVQEPYAGTIRFKWLVRLPSADAGFLVREVAGARIGRRLVAVTREGPQSPALASFAAAVTAEARRL